MTTASIVGEVLKTDEDQRLAFGWASVISRGGRPVVDLQGDIIEAEQLERAAAKFMLSARAGRVMHKGAAVATVIHSFPLTAGIAKAFGLQSDVEGWMVALRVHDDDLWTRVRAGEFPAFSIGGRGRRVPLVEA